MRSAPLFLFASLTLAAAADGPAINGVTEPFLDVTLSAPVPGIVSEEPVREGDFVRKGEVILALDKKLEEFELQRRTAVMDQSKLELDSTRALLETTKSVSKEESAKKEAQYNVAVAEHGIAAEELARRRIVAPFSGNIVEINLRSGAACAPYQPLARLVDTTRCYFVGHVEGKTIVDLKTNQPVRIVIEGARAPVVGKICFISPVVDPASGLAKVKAVFENADGKIRPGLAAKMIPEP